MEIKTFRTSTILVATKGQTRLFKSRAELTPAMRKSMRQSLNSPLAATILIADQRGRDEILKVLRGESSPLRGSSRSVDPALPLGRPAAVRTVLSGWLANRWVRALIAVALPAVLGCGFYLLLTAAH